MEMRRAVGLGIAVLLLGFGAVGVTNLPYTDDFDSYTVPHLPTNWAAVGGIGGGLWRTVSHGQFPSSASVPAFPSPSQALYYGNPATANYDTGSRTRGAVRTDDLGGFSPGDWLRVGFRFYRVVESYAPGGYDKAIAYAVFRNGAQFLHPDTGEVVGSEAEARKELFYKDSSHASSTAWETFESVPFRAPPGAVYVYIGFEFDSVDRHENSYLGWLIDDLKVEKVPGPLAITTAALPDGAVGREYGTPGAGFALTVEGGQPPYDWTMSGLDPRTVGLEFLSSGVLRGFPLVAGEWDLTFEVRSHDGQTATKTLRLRILRQPAAEAEKLHQCWDAGLGGWTATGLWHTTDEVRYLGNNILAGKDWGAYYGRSPRSVPPSTAYNYDTGLTAGALTSPPIDVSGYGEATVRLEFTYWREVERYDGGAYDKTWVEISFDGGVSWTTVWAKDSRDPSEKNWITETLNAGTVPARASSMFVQFRFDSVDAMSNRYVGWVLDCVRVFLVTDEPPELAVVTASLPDAQVGVAYSAALQAAGGTPPYTWSVTGLPSGLSVDPLTGEISGTPAAGTEGTYRLGVSVTDALGARAQAELALRVLPAPVAPLFFDDFASGNFIKWESFGGLWRVTNTVYHGGANVVPPARGDVAYYGQCTGTSCHYDVGGRTAGTLTSLAFPLDGATAFLLEFRYWREVESYVQPGYDKTEVQVRFQKSGTWGPWRTVWAKDCTTVSEKAWVEAVVGPYAVEPAGATYMQIRLLFDSVDKYNNRFVGWLVDDVRVTKASAGSPLPMAVTPAPATPRAGTQISFFNYPNPVRDVHTTTFAVRGAEAEAIRVEVFDLSGRLVYTAEVAGSELVWHTQDQLGRYLANGVYLYRVHAKVAGTWISSELQKLAIYR